MTDTQPGQPYPSNPCQNENNAYDDEPLRQSHRLRIVSTRTSPVGTLSPFITIVKPSSQSQMKAAGCYGQF
jgi:hypothetical protein